MIDFIKRWTQRTGIAVARFIAWLGLASSKYYDWQSRYGKANEHNALVPRDFWLEDWENRPSSTSIWSIRWQVIAA